MNDPTALEALNLSVYTRHLMDRGEFSADKVFCCSPYRFLPLGSEALKPVGVHAPPDSPRQPLCRKDSACFSISFSLSTSQALDHPVCAPLR